jgi:membrane protein implicated in regulation of membrane protease activity
MVMDLEPGWLWLIGGVLMLIAEVIAPGFFLLFIGSAAIATGAFALLFGLALPAQLTLFTLYSLLAVMVGRRVYSNQPAASTDPNLNDRAAQMIGKRVTAISAIDEHSGRVQVGDGQWSARGGPVEAGERVRITRVDGNCLIVESDRPLPPS